TRKMDESWRNRRLPEDLPCFISLSVNNLSTETGLKMEQAAGRQKRTGLFDTHPCDEDRVQAAAALNEPGIFTLAEPASSLFRDFSELSKAATRFHYEHNLGLRLTSYNLVPHDVAAKESQSLAEAETSLRKYFFDLKLTLRPIAILFTVS